MLKQAVALAVVSFGCAVAVYRLSDALLRRHAVADVAACGNELGRLDGELRAQTGLTAEQQNKRIARMLSELGRMQGLMARVRSTSTFAVLAGMAAGIGLLLGGVISAIHRSTSQQRTAALMDHARAREQDLSDASAFRFEEGRLVLTRPLSHESFDDLNDFRLAIARVIDGPGDALEIDASPIVSPTSQMFGLLAEAALEAREHGKSLRIVVSEEFMALAKMMGLDNVVRLSVRKEA